MLLVAAALVLTGGLLLWQASPGAEAATATTGTGGQLTIGAPSTTTIASVTRVVVPIDMSTAATNLTSGASIHLVYDTTQFSFLNTDSGGAGIWALDGPICAGAAASDGVIFSCNTTGAVGEAGPGELWEFRLTPTSPTACSNFHIFTLNGSDAGDSTTGSYTIDATSAQGGTPAPQANTYGPDVTISGTGTTGCTPSAPSTATPTNTAAPTDTATATNTVPPGSTSTSTSTATNTAVSGNTSTPVVVFRTVTPTVTPETPTVAPTNTPASGQPGGSTPGAQPSAAGTSPSGGQGAGITGPNTGTGPSNSGWNSTLIGLASLLVAAGVVVGGIGVAGWRRRKA